MPENFKTMDELKAEATGLGITFSPNIGEKTLLGKIDAFYESQSAGDLVKEKDESTSEDETETDETNEQTHKAGEAIVVDKPITKSKKVQFREMIMAAKNAAMKTRVVTITSNDKRDNDVATTTYLGFENQYFGISRIVPLDVPMELEIALIDVAKTTYITLHKDEIIDGKRTGNKKAVPVRKLNVSFEDMQA